MMSGEAYHWLIRTNRHADDKVLLEEYKSIRAEVTASIQAQISILAFGTATLGFSFAAASQTSNTSFRGMFLLVLVPLVAYLILIVWFSEVMRMQRAGTFLMRLEKRFDEHFGYGALTWESTIFQVRSRGGPRAFFEDPDKFRTLAITLLFFTIAGTSIVIGWGSTSSYGWQHWFALAALVTAAAAVAWLYVLREAEVKQLARPWLREGDAGEEVEKLQKALAEAGFYKSEADGSFGPRTRLAVKRLQAKSRLEVDGIAGLMTMHFLEELVYRKRMSERARAR